MAKIEPNPMFNRSAFKIIPYHRYFGFSYVRFKEMNSFKYLMLAYNLLMILAIIPTILSCLSVASNLQYTYNSPFIKTLLFAGVWSNAVDSIVAYVQIFFGGNRLLANIRTESDRDLFYLKIVWLAGFALPVLFAFLQFMQLFGYFKMIMEVGYSMIFVMSIYSYVITFAMCVIPAWFVFVCLSYSRQIDQITDGFGHSKPGNMITVSHFGQPKYDNMKTIAKLLIIFHKLLDYKDDLTQLESSLSPGLMITVFTAGISLMSRIFRTARTKTALDFDHLWTTAPLIKMICLCYFGEMIPVSLDKLISKMENRALDENWSGEEIRQLKLIRDLKAEMKFGAKLFRLGKSSLLAFLGFVLQYVVILFQTDAINA